MMTSLTAYANVVPVRRLMPSAGDAARALYTLNQEIKSGRVNVVYQLQAYPLKAALLQAFEREGFAYRIEYEPYTTPKPTYSFSFVVDRTVFRWHCIEEDVDWEPRCCDLPLPAGVRGAVGLDNRSVTERMTTIAAYLRVRGWTR